MAAIDGAMCELLHTCSKKSVIREQGRSTSEGEQVLLRWGRHPLSLLARLRSCWAYVSSLGLADWLCRSTQRGDRHRNLKIGKAALLFTVRPRHFQRGNRSDFPLEHLLCRFKISAMRQKLEGKRWPSLTNLSRGQEGPQSADCVEKLLIRLEHEILIHQRPSISNKNIKPYRVAQ
jgi:hypothetical protein